MSLTKEFTHLTRHIAPSTLQHVHSRIEQLLLNTSSKIIGTTWTTPSWTQAKLPIKKSGLAIPDIKDTNNAGYAASFRESIPHLSKTFPSIALMLNNRNNNCAPIREYDTCIQYIKENTSNGCYHLIDQQPPTSRFQQLFMDAIHERKHSKVVETSPSSEDKARIRASEGETAGAFLWTIPTTPNTTIPNSALKTAIKRRVGLNLQVPGICKCGKAISATGSHILTCTHGVGNHLRHNQVKHLLLNFSRRAGYSVQDEPTLLHDLAASKKGKRGDGLIYHASHEGKNIIFDTPKAPRTSRLEPIRT